MHVHTGWRGCSKFGGILKHHYCLEAHAPTVYTTTDRSSQGCILRQYLGHQIAGNDHVKQPQSERLVHRWISAAFRMLFPPDFRNYSSCCKPRLPNFVLFLQFDCMDKWEILCVSAKASGALKRPQQTRRQIPQETGGQTQVKISEKKEIPNQIFGISLCM
jgi:hypothetical protein